MFEEFNLEVFGSFGLVIALLGLWLTSLKAELKELKEDYDRLNQEYVNSLKAGNQRQQILDAEVMLGRRISNETRREYNTIDTQRIPDMETIRGDDK